MNYQGLKLRKLFSTWILVLSSEKEMNRVMELMRLPRGKVEIPDLAESEARPIIGGIASRENPSVHMALQRGTEVKGRSNVRMTAKPRLERRALIVAAFANLNPNMVGITFVARATLGLHV